MRLRPVLCLSMTSLPGFQSFHCDRYEVVVVMGTESGGGFCTNSGTGDGEVWSDPPFFVFSALAPSSQFVDIVEPFVSSFVAFVFVGFVRQAQVPLQVRNRLKCRVQGFVPILELVKAPTVVVRFPVQWYRLVPILLPTTLLVAPVFGDVMASFLLVDFPISRGGNRIDNHRAKIVFIDFRFC